MGFRKLFTRNEKGKERVTDDSPDLSQSPEPVPLSKLLGGSRISLHEEKKRKLGGSAISYGEKERVSPSASSHTVKERFGNFISAGHSPISTAPTTPREKTLKSSKSADNSPRGNPKRLGSLINFSSSRRKLLLSWKSLSNRSPSVDVLSELHAEQKVQVESNHPADDQFCEESVTSSSTTEQSTNSGNANPLLVEYMLETNNVMRDESAVDVKKTEETADSHAKNTSAGEMESQTNTECDSLTISDSNTSTKSNSYSDSASCRYDTIGNFSNDKISGIKTIIPKDSQVRYEMPALFTEEQAANLAKQIGLQYKLGDENVLAKGTFGEVSFAMVYNHPGYANGTYIAIKKVNKAALQTIAGQGNTAKKMMRTEIKITSKLLAKGFAIVPTIEMVRFKNSIYQMMPIYNLTGDDVVNYIKHQRSMPQEKREAAEEELVFLGVKTGIALAEIIVALHKINIFHFDIKPSNFFLNFCVKDGEIQIDFALGDFGSAHLLHKNKKQKVQITSATDPIYIAPEVNSVPRKNIDGRLISDNPKHKHQRLTLHERWRFGLTLAQLLDPKFSEEEFLKTGHMYYNEMRLQRIFHYSAKIPNYNEQLKKFKNVLDTNKYLPADLVEALQGLLNPDYFEREKTSLNTMMTSLKSYHQVNDEELDKGKEKEESRDSSSKLSEEDKKILGPLLEKVLAHKNNLLEQKRAEKIRAEQEKLEQERKRATLSSIHKMGKFSVTKKLAIDHLDDEAAVVLGLRNRGSTSS